jgi:hypothetical protein
LLRAHSGCSSARALHDVSVSRRQVRHLLLVLTYKFAAIVLQEVDDDTLVPKIVDKNGSVAWHPDDGAPKSLRDSGLEVYQGSAGQEDRTLRVSHASIDLQVTTERAGGRVRPIRQRRRLGWQRWRNQAYSVQAVSGLGDSAACDQFAYQGRPAQSYVMVVAGSRSFLVSLHGDPQPVGCSALIPVAREIAARAG